MASPNQSFWRFFRGSAADVPAAPVVAQKLARRSSGLNELGRNLKCDEPLCVLDIGATSPSNISYLTSMGHKVYSEDLLAASSDPELKATSEDGKPILDSRKFLADNLIYPNGQFDVVLCWNVADYMDESLVKPIFARLWSVMKPGGKLLAFFHTQDAGPQAPCYRFHIVNAEMLEMQVIGPGKDQRKAPSGTVHPGISASLRLQRVFNNRHIENLFRDFASIKFFLARDNVREVLVAR
ncbi:MAG: methyltransferase domain-containing protein [Acidobacteriales bacterium]|nr:methyltransferase domain-containing protein [Terriglobales bacterium]